MNLPTRAAGRGTSRVLGAFVPVLLALSLGSSPVLATHYVVDQNGSGDFTSIQAAISQRALVFRDSILVKPGSYDEDLVLPSSTAQAYIVGQVGATTTSTRSLTASAIRDHQTRVEGLRFTGGVTDPAGDVSCYFSRCVFEGAVQATSVDGAVNFEDCDFNARTVLAHYIGYLGPGMGYRPFEELRFHGAPLDFLVNDSGEAAFRNCSFEGPADTLVHVYAGWDAVNFEGCLFAGAGTGVVCENLGYGPATLRRCLFQDLSGWGILCDRPYRRDVVVMDSRFERCGTGVYWVLPGTGPRGSCHLERDTILASSGNGLVIGNVNAQLDSIVVEGSGGHGAALLQADADSIGLDPNILTITASTFTHNRGDGVYADGSGRNLGLVVGRQNAIRQSVFGNTFTMNGGAGLRMLGVWADVRDNLSTANGSDGIAFRASSPEWLATFESNSSVLNRGDGLSLVTPYVIWDLWARVQHNLAAMNAAAGIRVPSSPLCSLAFNDAWNNYLGQYVGPGSPADSNLTIDPRFCDLPSGLTGLGLQQGSPIGAGGIYGLIGARPEECPNVTAVAPPLTGSVAFSVRPTIARGSVEFVPPSSGPRGRVEIFDLTGRRLWSAPFGPATGTLAWQGQSDAGHAKPGLYWVRFTREGESQSQRLVWLK